jgi:hypothetical protein
LFPRFPTQIENLMPENEKKTLTVRVNIRPAKMQDFNNSENPSGISTGMKILLKNPEGEFKTYRLNEASNKERLAEYISRDLIWVPCSGFESEVETI